MRELFLAECVRVRRLVAIYAALHLAFLFVMARMVDLLQQELGVYQLFALVHVLAALAFGAWQLRGHRRPAAWMYLLHRPLPPARIGAAVLGAGALGAAAAVAVPIALALAAQALVTVRVVDHRHVGLVAAGALLAAAGQLAGALLAIAPARHLFAVVALLAWPLTARAGGVDALVVQLIVVAWLGALAVLAVRPDPGAVHRRAGPTVLLALPVAAGLALALGAGGSIGYEVGWILAGSHPLNSKPPAGGFVEAVNAEPGVLLGVSGDDEPTTISGGLSRLGHRGELTNVAAMEIDDVRRGTRWVFSHDLMRFVGMDRAGLERRGTLDVPGGFASPPAPMIDLIVDAHAAYRLDPASGRLALVVRVPADEVLAARPERHGEAWVVLSDRALRLVDAQDPTHILATLRLPVRIHELARVDLVRDGAAFRVSLVSGAGSSTGHPAGRHYRYRLDGATVTPIDERALHHDFPALLRDLDFVVGPALFWLQTRANDFLAAPEPLLAGRPAERARVSLIVALLLSLGAAAFVARRAGALGLPGVQVVLWTLAGLALGVPLALAFLLVFREPWPRAPDAPSGAPAPA